MWGQVGETVCGCAGLWVKEDRAPQALFGLSLKEDTWFDFNNES